jgi:hypothetical protein
VGLWAETNFPEEQIASASRAYVKKEAGNFAETVVFTYKS